MMIYVVQKILLHIFLFKFCNFISAYLPKKKVDVSQERYKEEIIASNNDKRIFAF